MRCRVFRVCMLFASWTVSMGMVILDVVPKSPKDVAARLVDPVFVKNFLREFENVIIGPWDRGCRSVSYTSSISTPIGRYRCDTTCNQQLAETDGVVSGLSEKLVLSGIPFVGTLRMSRNWSLVFAECIRLVVDFTLDDKIPWFVERAIKAEMRKQTRETFEAADSYPK